MHVISKPIVVDFIAKHPKRQTALEAWFRILSKGKYSNFIELKDTFPAVDQVGRLTVFDVAGNHVRVIVEIIYRSQTVFIKHVLTHTEYAKGNWKKS